MPVSKTIKKSVYSIGGLKGDHCRDRIEHTLSHLDGITDVDVNLNTRQVTVEYDANIIASGYIEETLQTLGYSIRR
ncbi:heavy-metal-associated domain-containing protein [Sporolituus thermophilus]|uniref:Copper chaperone n=1 Tax=Sporolituus thermophilus DSM 23256 TaxID=1123285 RepID=A0A1G7KSX8_9FIRM|nr:heavy-metal-associated domain-containing protein [Sporolituus thermophilus]SDF40174.1 copper chaperone [Sporolituus thermophilus DSM 23256]